MSHSGPAAERQAVGDHVGDADGQLRRQDSNLTSSRAMNSSSRLSYYTEANTRRSSIQSSAQTSLYQDAESSAIFTDADDDFADLDIGSDLDVRGTRVPSRLDRSRTASPLDYPRPRSAAGSTLPPYGIAAARRSNSSDTEGALETTVEGSSSLPSGSGTTYLHRRGSSRKQSIDELSRPMSSLSRRSSVSAQHDDPQSRLREAATAAANRSSISARRQSGELNQLANNLSRASTPHGFRTDEDDDDSARPRSRPGSSLALRKHDQDDGSFIKRDGRDRGSILPPAAFFAPKKPSARNSSSNLLASATSPTSPQAGRSTTPLSFYLSAANPANADTSDSHPREEILDFTNISHLAYEPQPRAPSPWGLAASTHSVTSSNQHPGGQGAILSNGQVGAQSPRSPQDGNDGFSSTSVQPSPHSVIRMMASTDPLLPARAIPSAANAAHGNTNTGLGLETAPVTQSDATTALPRAGLNDQRASLPVKRHSQTQADKPEPVASAAATVVAKASKRGARKYRNHKGDNRFLLCGLLMTSGDNPLPFIASYVLLLALGGLFFGFEAKWLSNNISPAVVAVFAYIWLQAVVNMGVTAWKDPGIIPRGLDPDPPCVLGDTSYEPGRQALADPEDPLAIPVQRALRIKNQTVKVKCCETCGTYRPPRSSHCRVCDNCVENIDHHCTYLNTCIGRRNYVQFMVFLFTSILSAFYTIAFTALRLVLLTKPTTYRYPRNKGSITAPGYTFRQALSNTPVSAVLFLLCVGVVGPLLVLFSYHVRLVLLNRSTVEQIRINTARDYGEHKELEMGTHGDDDAASTYGAAETNKRGRPGSGTIRAFFERFGVLKPKYKDPNPFASRGKKVNLRNAVGWRSVQLESWIDRRGREVQDTRLPHPRTASKLEHEQSQGKAMGMVWNP